MAEKNTSKQGSWKLFLGGTLLILIAGGFYFYLASSKESSANADSQKRSKEAAQGIIVRTAFVTPSTPQRNITIPGEVRSYAEVTLYAKITGYLKSISIDKGDNVREGQVLATIESPETDRTYLAAEATAKNLRSIAKRNQDLLKQALIAPQDAEQAIANADAAEETLKSIAEQRSYEIIKAPFAGKITARYADAGSLLQSTSNSVPIVTISEVNRLRIYIYLDQKDASFVKEGDSVSIRLLERPDINIKATITRYTGEIDSRSRTLLAEIDLDNKNNVILPGSFVQVSLRIKAQPLLQMPSEALIIKGKDYFAAVVDANGILHMRKIEIADNDGRTIQIVSGIAAGDQLALGIGDALKDGDKVQVSAPPVATGK
jgi:membrane fusion protein (multidrug efflux system)